MNNSHLQKLLIITCVAALSACVTGTQNKAVVPAVAAAKATDNSRVVSIRLEADATVPFSLVPGMREVIAEPVVESQIRQAKGRYELNGVDVVIIGDSCSELREKITTLSACEESDAIRISYGPEVITGLVSADRLVELTLERRAYRVTVERVRTSEDASCWWSGSVVLPEQSTSVKLPMLVYCE